MRQQEVMHHVHLKEGDIGKYVFLPGDPGRTNVIAGYFDDAKLIAEHREYRTFTGTLNGEKVSVTSTGIGGPSAAIALEELVMLGADTFIRVGTSGGMQPQLRPGDLGIITGAIRDEGTSLHYMYPEFPAVANIEIVLALREAAAKLGYNGVLGISHSKDSFYGQHMPERMPIASRLQERWEAWKAGGAICSEMESATLFILGSIYRVRTGGIMLIAANQESDDPNVGHTEDLGPLIETSIEAARILIARARETSS